MEACGYEAEGQDEEEKGIVDTLSKQEKDAAKLLVKNMTIDFNSRNFENPSIQQFYAGLQALALGEKEPEPIEDLLEPDYEGMKRFDPLFQKFKDAFFDGEDADPECAATTAGRGRGGARGGRGGRGGRGAANAGSSQASGASGVGRGRGAAPPKAPEKEVPKKGGRGAKNVKDMADDLDNYDQDMNEKELPASSSQATQSKSAVNPKKRKEPASKVDAKQKNSKRKKGESSSEDEYIDNDEEEEFKKPVASP